MTQPLRILDVGQCGFDHSAIADVAHKQTGAIVEQAGSAAQAVAILASQSYDLVLINRILDGDGTSGVDLIAQLKTNPNCPPLMMVSNYPDAQRAAVKAGALEGFGKNALYLASTAKILQAAVERKTASGG